LENKPWELNPELTEDRLKLIGKTIKEIRNKAISLYDPEEGDAPWSLGCRVYDRTINMLPKLINESWFGYVKSNLYFVMLIEGTPIRFYRGNAECPPGRTLVRNSLERQHYQMGLFGDDNEWFWRIAVETDHDYQTLRITIAQYNDVGDFKNLYEIPIDEPIATVISVTDRKPKAVDLGKPEVFKREKIASGGISNEGERKTKIPG
jgi:hypothetical protein